ncbi:MAG: hypothetical protein IJA85_10320 [Clostridia bacterium]|nr:hypothetical protein [Clostridia bacterium]
MIDAATNAYIQALAQVYNEIFEFDLEARTVRCLHGHFMGMAQTMRSIRLVMDDSVNYWLEHLILPEDRATVREAFDRLIAGEIPAVGKPSQVEFRIRSSSQKIRYYLGLFVKVDPAACILCCCDISKQREAEALQRENQALKGLNQHMKAIVEGLTDGMLAFEVTNDLVMPLYISDNICDFFSISRDTWMNIMKQGIPIRDFLSQSNLTYEAYLKLLADGSAEFNYIDVSSGNEMRIRAISNTIKNDDVETHHIMLYDITEKYRSELRLSQLKSSERDDCSDPTRNGIYIRTFGYFDVFIDGKPIAFRHEKSKELFALLVDRRGGFVSSSDAIGFLWEDEPVTPVTLARYRKVALRLRNLLEEYGIADVIEAVDGKRRIIPERIRCDLYDYLSRDAQFASLFNGSYLSNYSWAEITLAQLLDSQH